MGDETYPTLEYRMPAQLVVVKLEPLNNSLKVVGKHGDELTFNREDRHLCRIDHFAPQDIWAGIEQYYRTELLDEALTDRLRDLMNQALASGTSRFVKLRHGLASSIVGQRAWDGVWHDIVESALQHV